MHRFKEIPLRNKLRKEAGLPLLSVVKALRRMKTTEDAERFHQFATLHQKAVWNEVLESDLNWKPG
jgi:hypothetical protein